MTFGLAGSLWEFVLGGPVRTLLWQCCMEISEEFWFNTIVVLKTTKRCQQASLELLFRDFSEFLKNPTSTPTSSSDRSLTGDEFRTCLFKSVGQQFLQYNHLEQV